MYDDPNTPFDDPSESGQNNDSDLFKYLSLLGSAANRYREQLQDQHPPQDASLPDLLKQVRGVSPEEPRNDAMQRLSGLFKSDPPSPDKNPDPAFAGFSRFPELLPGVRNDSSFPRPYVNPSFQLSTDRPVIQPKPAFGDSPVTPGSALPLNSVTGGKQDGPIPANPPPSNTLPAALQQWIAANRSNSFGAGAVAAPPPMQQPLDPKEPLSDNEPKPPDSFSVPPPDRNAFPMIAKTETAVDASAGIASDDEMMAGASSKAKNLQDQGPKRPKLTGTVGTGGTNNPADVELTKQFLNADADFNNIPGPRLPLDGSGQVTPQLLQRIAEFQKSNKIKPELISEKSATINMLREIPGSDANWDAHDRIIRQETDRFNVALKKKYPNFPGLDPRLVEAMIWRESGGPYYQGGKHWKNRPMQIGNPGDKGIRDLVRKDPPWYIKAVADSKTLADIKYAHAHNKWTPELNIRAGIIYFLGRSIESMKTVQDPKDRNEYVTSINGLIEAHKKEPDYKPPRNLTNFAPAVGTTLDELYNENPELRDKNMKLYPWTRLKYHKASLVPVWRDMDNSLHQYNVNGDPNYLNEVMNRYKAIQKRHGENTRTP